jgi:hypothetical protein
MVNERWKCCSPRLQNEYHNKNYNSVCMRAQHPDELINWIMQPNVFCYCNHLKVVSLQHDFPPFCLDHLYFFSKKYVKRLQKVETYTSYTLSQLFKKILELWKKNITWFLHLRPIVGNIKGLLDPHKFDTN